MPLELNRYPLFLYSTQNISTPLSPGFVAHPYPQCTSRAYHGHAVVLRQSQCQRRPALPFTPGACDESSLCLGGYRRGRAGRLRQLHRRPHRHRTVAATRGNTTAGTVQFAQTGDVVKVSGTITGLKPGAEHGFHIHEKGDCSSGDGMSAGGHFNPGGKPHGHHGKGEHHTGDLPSLKADANGTVSFNFESRSIRVGSTANDIVGKGLIVHRDPDDYTTQPTGNAGPRLACAVITVK